MTREHLGLASRVIAARGSPWRPAEDAGAPSFTHHHFSVAQQPVTLQALAWSERVSGLLDTPMSRVQRQQSFAGEMDSYVFKDMIYLDCRTDPLAQSRTLAKISRDNVRDFVFHVAVEGIMETLTDTRRERKSTQFVPGILALDMGQTMRMLRPTYAHVLAFFLPRATVEAEIADADALHGQVLAYTSPLTRLLLAHLVALSRDLRSMPPAAAEEAIRVCVDLLLAPSASSSVSPAAPAPPPSRRCAARSSATSRRSFITGICRRKACCAPLIYRARPCIACLKTKAASVLTSAIAACAKQLKNW